MSSYTCGPTGFYSKSESSSESWITFVASTSIALSHIISHINQIDEYFSSHNLYNDSQYGFRKKHSTEHAALELVDRISQELDKGNTPSNIFIDLSKAFDTLDHKILRHKLNHYGFNGPALNIIKVIWQIENNTQNLKMLHPHKTELLPEYHKVQY